MFGYSLMPSNIEKRHQSCLTLKLCKNHEDIVDIDSYDAREQGPVRCAIEYEDGTFASVAVLGRNRFTGIDLPNIPRAICEVSLKLIQPTTEPLSLSMIEEKQVAACITMRKQGGHECRIDGKLVNEGIGVEIPIDNGSVISLHDNSFAYIVQIEHHSENQTGSLEAESKKLKSISSGEKSPLAKESLEEKYIRAQKSAKKMVEKSSTCALCLEIMVCTTLAYPCAHHFCYPCTQELRASISHPKCPLCRNNVTNWMPGRDLDDMIWANALLGCYDSEYANTYLDRREEHMNFVPSEEEKQMITKMALCDDKRYCEN